MRLLDRLLDGLRCAVPDARQARRGDDTPRYLAILVDVRGGRRLCPMTAAELARLAWAGGDGTALRQSPVR